MSNIHRGSCSSLAVSRDGKYLATAGDRLVKMWDYHMRLDINFQVFTVYLLSSNADIRPTFYVVTLLLTWLDCNSWPQLFEGCINNTIHRIRLLSSG